MRLRLRLPIVVIATFLAALVTTASDVVSIISRQYHWMPNALVGYAEAWRDLPWRVIWPTALLIVLGSLLSATVLTMRGIRPIKIWPVATGVAFLAMLDAMAGSSQWQDTTSGYDILTISSVAMPARAIVAGFQRPSVVPTNRPSLADDLRGPLPLHILSIGVESFGLSRSIEKQKLLLNPLIEGVDAFYTIEQSKRLFHGSTLAGEMRELCGLAIEGVPDAGEPRLRQCLPNRLRDRGYITAALHGNGGSIYSRSRLYPAIGFNDLWFYDRLRKTDPAVIRCKGMAFGGACDDRVYARALSLFDQRPRFVHVMTLDAHLPLARTDPIDCPVGFRENPTLCSYAHVTRHSFAALAHAIVAARVRPDLIVLYGDHAPPFSSTELRAQFSRTAIPYIVLRRR